MEERRIIWSPEDSGFLFESVTEMDADALLVKLEGVYLNRDEVRSLRDALTKWLDDVGSKRSEPDPGGGTLLFGTEDAINLAAEIQSEAFQCPAPFFERIVVGGVLPETIPRAEPYPGVTATIHRCTKSFGGCGQTPCVAGEDEVEQVRQRHARRRECASTLADRGVEGKAFDEMCDDLDNLLAIIAEKDDELFRLQCEAHEER